MARNLIPENTVVETSDTGVLVICGCSEQRPGDELYATVPEDGTDRNVVIVHRDGDVTNWYGDGVAGVTDRDREAAEQDDELYCPECENYIRGWLHTADE